MADVYPFGVAGIWFTPPGTAQTPVPIGGAQGLTLEVSEEVKEYYGQYKYPLAVAKGKGKATLKGTFGRMSLDLAASVLNGSTIITGSTIPVANEAVTIASNTYTVSMATGFNADFGIWDLVNGKPFTRMADGTSQGSLTTGQYVVNTTTGVYTFATADATKALAVSYSYASASTGRTLAYGNQLMGAATLFSFFGTVKDPAGNSVSWKMPAVIIPKLSFALKNDDFMGQDFEATAQADASGNVVYIYAQ